LNLASRTRWSLGWHGRGERATSQNKCRKRYFARSSSLSLPKRLTDAVCHSP